MSQETLLMRSVLSVPANRERMIAKARDLPADMIMLDLEDSVPGPEKEEARAGLEGIIHDFPWQNRVRGLRINSMQSPLAHRDVVDIISKTGEILQVLVVPKVEQPWELQALDWLLGQLESEQGLQNGTIKLQAIIETAQGLANVREISRCSSRMQALVFGVADFAASMGIAPGGLSGHGESQGSYPGHRWQYALCAIAVAARSAGLQILDAPYGDFQDPEGLKHSSHLSAQLGYDGKWVIHPDQIQIVNQAYTPDAGQLQRAEQIISAWQTAREKGSLAVEGSMIDQATLRLARMTLDKARLIQNRDSG